ncbi:MAG: hypothetical protein CMP23_06500 [Rickettsiales bacterium]|nr:hypothetical protein [Rickettsiales bacterium]
MVPFIHPRFELFGVTLDWWLILVVLGVAAATELGRARAIREGLSVKLTVDGILFVVGMGFLFGHFVYQIFYNWENLSAQPKLILPWYGGYASTGGFLGAGIGIWLFYVVWKKAPLWAYMDNMAIALCLGWVFGRLGCFAAHDHKGNLTDFPLAITFPDNWTATVNGQAGTWLGTRHDLGLYEALLALALLIMLLVLDRKTQWSHGMLAGLLLVCYAPVRFSMEFMRATDLANSDPRHLGLTPAQYGTFITLSLGTWMLLSRRGEGQMDLSVELARDYQDGKVPPPAAPAQTSPPPAGEAPGQQLEAEPPAPEENANNPEDKAAGSDDP